MMQRQTRIAVKRQPVPLDPHKSRVRFHQLGASGATGALQPSEIFCIAGGLRWGAACLWARGGFRPRPYPPRATSARGTSASPFPRVAADDAAPKTYRNKTSTNSARPAQISRPPPPAWCLRRNRCSSTFRNFLYSGRTSVGRCLPVGARRLSACAKTLSSSLDAFIAPRVLEQFRIANPKAKISVAV